LAEELEDLAADVREVLGVGLSTVPGLSPGVRVVGRASTGQIDDVLVVRSPEDAAALVAAATAQARVPNGKIQGVELEREKDRLIYSYDIKTAGKTGIDEVHVDAMTGKIISFAHESPAAEKKEAAEDAKAAKAATAKAKKP